MEKKRCGDVSQYEKNCCPIKGEQKNMKHRITTDDTAKEQRQRDSKLLFHSISSKNEQRPEICNRE